MNRHVAKTGDIKSFVITEEAGIAKGIRRMIAITGEDARKASERANEAEARFDGMVTKLTGSEKDKAFKSFEPELNQLDISIIRKVELKTKLEAARRAILEETKAFEKVQIQVVSIDVST